jgi:hypothetical protein
MHCRVCSSKKISLLQTVAAKSMRAPGYEHRSFRCLICFAEERRLAFVPQDLPPSTAEAPSIAEAPPKRAVGMEPAAMPSHKVTALAALSRAMGKLRNGRRL